MPSEKESTLKDKKCSPFETIENLCDFLFALQYKKSLLKRGLNGNKNALHGRQESQLL